MAELNSNDYLGIASILGQFALSGLLASPIYSSDDVTVLINGKVVKKYNSLQINFDAPNVTKVKGINGEVGYNINQDRSGWVDISFYDMVGNNKDTFELWKEVIYATPFTMSIYDDNDYSVTYVFSGCLLENKPTAGKNMLVGELTYRIAFTNFATSVKGNSYFFRFFSEMIEDFV